MTDTEISDTMQSAPVYIILPAYGMETLHKRCPYGWVLGFGQGRQERANLLFGGITLEHSRHADLHPHRLRCCFLKLASPCPLAGRWQAVSGVVSCGTYNMVVLRDAVM